MKYIFKTTTTMKPYNKNNWWIDKDIVAPARIEADNIQKALEQYCNIVQDKNYITISKNAIRNKKSMYIDTENGPQKIGYVITGKTEFENRENQKYSAQYIDLWIEIITTIPTF